MANVEQLAAEWLELYCKSTKVNYQYTIKKFITFCPLELEKIKASHIRNWLDSLQEAESSKVKHVKVLKSFFNYLVQEEILNRSPIPRQFQTPTPKNESTIRILSEEEIREMLENTLDPEKRLIIQILYITGIRAAEICQLRWKDVQRTNDAGEMLIYAKGGKTRKIRIPPRLWLELQEFKPRKVAIESTIFTTRTGKLLDRVRVYRIIKEAARAAELPNADRVSPHWLRHSHATHALEKGIPIHVVQSTLGHEDIQTTSKYLHVMGSNNSGEVLENILMPRVAAETRTSALRSRVEALRSSQEVSVVRDKGRLF